MLMQSEMIAGLPIWAAGFLVIGAAVLGAVVIELAARRLVPLALRQDNVAVTSAMFTVVGTTYAVLLAFVAMLAWEGFNKAQEVTDTEASLVQTVLQLVDGLTGPEMAAMHADILGYADTVIHTEWPAQARGRPVAENEPHLDRLTATALHLRPANIADGNLHRLLLDDLTQLARSRRDRLLAERTPIPVIVWFVLLLGGGITVAFASFLGTPSQGLQLAMSSLLAASGGLVLLLIIALSNPFRGDFRVSVEPFERAVMHMTQPPE